MKLIEDPLNFTGRCRSQAKVFLETELYKTISPYLEANELLNSRAKLDV